MTADAGPGGSAPVPLGTGRSRPRGLAGPAAAAFRRARTGDAQAVDELVESLTPLLWHTARSHGADRETARDVVQTTWMRFVENLERIEDPTAVLGWLLTTTRREAWRVSRRENRSAGQAPIPELSLPDPAPGPAERAVLTDRQRVLWGQVARLSERCRALLRVIAIGGRPDYASVARALGMPVGSIGPTRGRCLTRLRRALEDDPRWEGGR